MYFPHYENVPKDYEENMRWRSDVRERASKDEAFSASMVQKCSEDCLFYINGFVYTLDQRVSPKGIPFITYRFQNEAIAELITAIEEGHDLVWEKSRDMGATWMGICVIEWLWHFKSDLSFELISRNQDYIDSDSPKSLFYKIDFIHRYQPRWLLPIGRALGAKDPNRIWMHLRNAETGSVIDGKSPISYPGCSDRRTAVFIDEHAAFDIDDGYKVLRCTRDVTPCRIINSTPRGENNAFCDAVHKMGSLVRRMDRSQHPVHRKEDETRKEEGDSGLPTL